jgi:hypothetical protein
VFELLQHTRIDLYRKVIELVNTLYTPVPAPAPRKPEPTPAPRKPEPTPPYFVLSGKLTFWCATSPRMREPILSITCRKHHNSHHEHINGWFETPLDDFDPAADFTVLGWIRSQVQPCTAIAINIQCAELGQSLLAIGEWDRNGLLQVVRAWHKGPNPVWFRDSAKSRIQVQKWQHVAFTQTYGKMCYYLDGKLVASSDVVGVAHTPVSKVCSDRLQSEYVYSTLSTGEAVSRAWQLQPEAGRPVGRRDRGGQVVDTRSEPGECSPQG